jgi:protein O-GlcNAc transferase
MDAARWMSKSDRSTAGTLERCAGRTFPAGGAPSQEPLNAMARDLHAKGRQAALNANWQQGVHHFQLAVFLYPRDAGFWNDLGAALAHLQRWPEAAAAFGAALHLDPSHSAFRERLARALEESGALSAALVHYAAALPHSERPLRLLLRLGSVSLRAGLFTNAVEWFQKAAARFPQDPGVWEGLGVALTSTRRVSEALTCFRKALSIDTTRAAAAGHLLLARHYLPERDPLELRDEHADYAARISEGARHDCPGARTGSRRRLRIGYFSPDFRHQAVAFLVEPLLAAHDRTRFEAVCFSDVARPDKVTEHLRSLSDEWVDVSHLSNSAAAQVIRDHRVDVLVDLCGPSHPQRLAMFAGRPAPVQLTALGYPNTTGLADMDFRLTDPLADPPHTDIFHTETLLRLDRCFLCYGPPRDAPPTSRVSEPSGTVFCCFNALPKLTNEVLRLWAAILHRVPGSRLLLKSLELADPRNRESLEDDFRALAIPASRLILLPPPRAFETHLACYRFADIALDTFPYNGTLTTCEALWMGLPVVTLTGDAHAGRTGTSILKAAGLSDWITASPAEYVDRAAAAAGEVAHLAATREARRAQMAASPLCDATAYARAVEAVYADACCQRGITLE